MFNRLIKLIFVIVCFGSLSLHAQKRDSVVFVSTNDIHAALDQFPRFAYMVDSLRNLYPDLFLVGGGDYNSGNPFNDYYKPAGYPMIALMNAVGFDVSAVGNHEFDVWQTGFGLNTQVASFPFIAANVHPDEKFGIVLHPYVIRKLPNGKKVAFVGFLQIEADGLPSTHHDKVKDIRFERANNILPKYKFLRDSADLVVLVNHLGAQEDRDLARENPWVDLIIGGHSHTFIDGADKNCVVPMTQSGNKLQQAALTIIVFEDGKKVSTTIKSFTIDRRGKEKEPIKRMLNWFERDPYYQTVVATATAHFKNSEQLGYLMTDAYRAETGSDIAFQNPGGVRMKNFLRGPIRIVDVFILDPFGNEMMTINLTGKEIRDFVLAAWSKDYNGPIYSSGVNITYFTDGKKNLQRVELRDEKGNLLIDNKSYKVAYSNYIYSAYKYPHKADAVSLKKTTAQVTIDYLKKLGNVKDYSKEASRFSIVKL